MYRSHVLVCGGTGCTSSGSERIISALEHEIQDNGLSEEVKVIKTGCFGLCASGGYLPPPFGCWKTGEGRNLHGSAMITY